MKHSSVPDHKDNLTWAENPDIIELDGGIHDS